MTTRWETNRVCLSRTCSKTWSRLHAYSEACTHLAEELFFQLKGPALVGVDVGGQVANVRTLQHHLHTTDGGAVLTCVRASMQFISPQLNSIDMRIVRPSCHLSGS